MKEKMSVLWKELRNIGYILMPFLIYYITYFVAAIVLSFIMSAILQSFIEVNQIFLLKNEASINGVIVGMAMLIGIIPLWTSFRQETKRMKEAEQKDTNKEVSRFVKIPVTILLAISSSLAVNILFIMLHLMENSKTYQEVAQNQYGVVFGLGLVLYGIVSPLAEEVVFRGIVFNRMKREYSVISAVLLSALIFGFYHGNSVQGIYAFLIGCLIAYTYERFGSFFYAVLFHGAANVAVYTITGTEALYKIIVTPVNCVVFTLISIILIFIIEKIRKVVCK